MVFLYFDSFLKFLLLYVEKWINVVLFGVEDIVGNIIRE